MSTNDKTNQQRPEGAITSGPPKEWTVMIYLAGDNNLSEECVWAIKELYRVGLGSDIAVVAQYDSVAPGMPVTRYDITDLAAQRGTAPTSQPAQRVMAQTIEQDTRAEWEASAAPRNMDRDGGLNHQAHDADDDRAFVTATALIKFVADCVTKHPANHYMLVLSGHGSGAVGRFFLKSDSEHRFLSVPMLAFAVCKINEELARVKEAKASENETYKLSDTLDILGLDACAMSTVEVGHQLKDVARYMVGAEGFERNSGWPYHRVLQALNTKPGISPDELATEIVKLYVKYYFDYSVAGVSVDQAACDLSRMDALAAAVNKLAELLAEALEKDNQAILDAVILAHWKAQSYLLEDYVDLWDFCDLLQKSCDKTQPQVSIACGTVKKLIEPEDESSKGSTAVLKSCVSGADFQHSHGLSIYLPWVEVSDLYSHLGFAFEQRPVGDDCPSKHLRQHGAKGKAVRSAWFKFIQQYVDKSRRPLRRWRDKPTGDELLFGHPLKSLPLPLRVRRTAGSDHPASLLVSVRFAGTKNDKFAGTKDDKFGVDLDPKIKNPPVTFFKDPCIDEKAILDDDGGKPK